MSVGYYSKPPGFRDTKVENNRFAGNRRNNRAESGRKIYRCTRCMEEDRGFCDHCFQCGSNSHKKAKCPETKKN